ncbi:hypothetical protein ACFYT3_24955 [Nocardia amikacinitolerans]|uniref:hypothetical protein n=1 Tax=Nocardia amikacinitolerans TaxID=756689 RepID=UPI000AA2EABF|nr:hypothetical protein [Nocardia amikacinitolerans]
MSYLSDAGWLIAIGVIVQSSLRLLTALLLGLFGLRKASRGDVVEVLHATAALIRRRK